MNIQRGFRDKVEKYADPNREISVEMNVNGSAVYDYCCFGVDAAGILSDDRYMVFYNQTQSPGREITFSADGSGAKFDVNLNKLPSTINKLVFTVSIDGNGTMGNIVSHTLNIKQNRQIVADMTLTGKDFHTEKAIIAIEIYKKDVWRFAAVASGFNGGLGDLLRAYGGEEIESPAPTPQPAPAPQPTPKQNQHRPLWLGGKRNQDQQNQPTPQAAPAKVSLEKKLQKEAPQLVSLAKPLQLELEKQNLQNTVARVALVLDISGSMFGRYSDGTVQEIVNKTLPLAVQFDDDGELDFWYYGSRCKRMKSVNMKNYTSAVPRGWNDLMRSLGYGNNEPVVMKEVLAEYKRSKLPAYVIFITDGGVGSESEIKRVLIEASHEPIFWQFVGVGGSGYGVLERLDNMSGRYVDNANFFALDDFKRVSNSELYSRLLNEFPKWLQEIKRKRMI